MFELPGLQMNPFPSAGISVGDRQSISDIYMGIAAQIPPFLPNQTCWAIGIGNAPGWISSPRNSSPWKKGAGNNPVWHKGIGATSTWSKESQGTSVWEKEDEIIPC